jgi:tRNA A37 threonylcarbamoyladenosine modification protein TsaB
MKLYIDSTDNLKTIVKLDEFELVKEYQKPQDQDVLGAIQELLQRENKTPKDISEIEVVPGPGSFTGSRVGVAIANAMAFGLGILVNGQKPPVEPIYSSEPHVTTPKKAR